METTLPLELIEIQYEDATYHAAVCHRCGTKIYPAEQLEPHLDRHQLKDLYLEGELKKAAVRYGKNEIKLDSRRLRVGSPVFHERKLEHLGVTVRVCGYQPQGVPSIRGHPLPQKLNYCWIHTPARSIWDRLGATRLLSKRPPRPPTKAAKQDKLLARFKLLPARFHKSYGFPVVLKGLLFFSLQRKRTRQLLMDLG